LCQVNFICQGLAFAHPHIGPFDKPKPGIIFLRDQQKSYALETTASRGQIDRRQYLAEMFLKSPLPTEDLLFNLGLYTRSSLLVKYLVLYELYRKMLPVPGVIMEFGTWWGQNLVLLENLRAILEPFNKQRKIIGFDSFSGYSVASGRDGDGEFWKEGSYSTSEGYKAYLEELLQTHEGSNVLGHVTGVHELVEGDVRETVPAYLSSHPEAIVAFGYFDLGLYEPTVAALRAIKPHLVPGSIILFDELTWPEAPGEAIAFREVFTSSEYSIEKVVLYPSKALITIK
jgi:hypothetical protein